MLTNDYVRGILESVTYFLRLIDDGTSAGSLRREMMRVRQDALNGLTLDFKARLKAMG